MDKRRGPALLLVSLLPVVLLCLTLYRYDNKYTRPGDQPISGVLVLSDDDLARTPLRYLVREWTFFPDQLLTPRTVQAYGGYRRYQDVGQSTGRVHDSGTYRLVLLLPEEPRTYALELPEVYSACRLYAGGTQLLALGDPETGTPGIASRLVTFDAAGETELLLAYSDRSGVYSGLTYPPAFGLPQAVLRAREVRLLLHEGAVLLALICGIAALCFGLRADRRRGALFALCCVCFIGFTGYPLLHAMTTTAYQPWYTLEAGCLYALLFLAVLLQCDLAGLPVSAAVRLSLPCGVGLAASLIRAGGAAFWGADMGAFFSGLSALLKYYAGLCLLVLSIRMLWRRDAHSVPLLWGSASLGICLLFDRLFPLYEPLYGGWFGEIGGMCLTAGLGVALLEDSMDAARFRLTYAGALERMEGRLALQKEHYTQLSAQIQRARESAHDLRHHTRVIRTLAEQGQTEQILRYLSGYEPHLAEREVTVYSDHPVADAVLCQYAARAKALGAVYDVRFAVPHPLSLPDDELCILLGNLLENAVDALARQKEGRRTLYLRGEAPNGQLRLVLDNSFDGVLCQREDLYLSTKHSGFGVGLRSIRHLAEKYGGLADFSAEGGVFHSSVLIPLPGGAVGDARGATRQPPEF